MALICLSKCDKILPTTVPLRPPYDLRRISTERSVASLSTSIVVWRLRVTSVSFFIPSWSEQTSVVERPSEGFASSARDLID